MINDKFIDKEEDSFFLISLLTYQHEISLQDINKVSFIFLFCPNKFRRLNKEKKKRKRLIQIFQLLLFKISG